MRYTWKVTTRLHDRASWDMHSHGAEIVKPEHDRLPIGATVTGIVVCHHAFGLGMFLADRDEYGHVNITEVKPGVVRSPEDFPATGSSVEGIVLGYTGIDGQLRISLRQAHP
jgi:predicted RNA-binding protein with RPS1 domain